MAILPTESEILTGNQVQQIDDYIGVEHTNSPSLSYLNELIQSFMLKVPFENINVQNKVEIDLTLEGLMNKIVLNHRGGFCYEMNTLFKHYLLTKGFRAFNTSATIVSPKGRSRAGSHMTTIVTIDDARFIADVGFGDLPIQAIPIGTEQTYKTVEDVNGTFRAIQINGQIFVQKQVDGTFTTKYEAAIKEQQIADFKENIEFNQYNSESIFVKQLLITMPTQGGRVTMTHNHVTITEDEQKKIQTVTKENYKAFLNQYFGLDIQIERLEDK